MLCSISTTTLIPSLQHISVDQIRCTLVHNLNLFHLLLFNSIFPQLPINKSLSFLRGFYWYLTIIEGRVFPSLYLAVRYYSGKLLPDLFLTVTNKCWYVQIIPKGNYWSFCCCFFLRIIFFEQRRIII